MRLLINGSDKVFSIERFYVKYLREKNVEVTTFSSQDIFYKFYNRSLWNKILFRIGVSSIYQRINREFKEIVIESRPDIILVFKGLELFPSTLAWAKNRGIKLVNYNPDNPFVFSGRGSGNSNITNSIALFDLYLTYDEGVKDRMIRESGVRSAILPFGFDLEEQVFEACTKQPEVPMACFVGNPDKYRADLINQLADAGISIHVYGGGWQRFSRSRNITCFDAVYGDAFWMTLRKYRVQLNIMRPHNPESHNMRTFEIGAVGGIQLAPNTADHRRYFNESTEIFVYSDVPECIDKIKYLISLSQALAEQIRASARMRSVLDGYDYKHRTMTLYAELSKLL